MSDTTDLIFVTCPSELRLNWVGRTMNRASGVLAFIATPCRRAQVKPFATPCCEDDIGLTDTCPADASSAKAIGDPETHRPFTDMAYILNRDLLLDNAKSFDDIATRCLEAAERAVASSRQTLE